VADETEVERTALEGIVGLRRAPDIVIADGARISVPNSDLIVKGLGVLIPHLLQPVETKAASPVKFEALEPAPIWLGKSRTPMSMRATV